MDIGVVFDDRLAGLAFSFQVWNSVKLVRGVFVPMVTLGRLLVRNFFTVAEIGTK